ncbi:YdbH domain-containing protein [Gammaproteobacteria bacterium]|nr:YdbH domain-containing protein [Gammaproteobacteria bacterium]
MSITLRALKKPLLIAAASVLAAVIGGCALLLAAPAMIINPLAKNIALSQGIVLQKLVIVAPVRAKSHKGRRVFTLSIETASGAYEGDSFELIDTEIAFGLHDLFAGRLDSIAIAEAKIRAPAKASETESLLQPSVSAQLAPLFLLQQQLLSFPVNSLSIKSMLLTLGADDLLAPQISAELNVFKLPDGGIDIDLAAEIAENALNSEAGPLSLTAALALPEQDRMTLSAKFVLDEDEAIVSGTAEKEAFALSIEADTGFTSLVDLSALIQQITGSDAELSVRVPDEKITLAIEAEGEQLAARISPSTLEVRTALLKDAVSRVTVSNAGVTCTRLERCAGELTFSMLAEPSGSVWFSIPMSAESEILAQADANMEQSPGNLLQLKMLSVELPLRFAYRAGEIDLSSTLSTLSTLPTLRLGPWQTRSSSGELLFELKDIQAHFGRVSSIRGKIDSTEAAFNLAGVELNSPKLSVSIDADTLDANAIAELSLAGKPFAGASIAHSFARDTGSLDLRIEPAGFSLTTPLSALVNPLELQTLVGNADLVAGNVEMRADLGWSRQQSGAWILGGPLVAKIDAVSGFKGETLFVGADTEIFAEVAYSQEQDFTLFTAQPTALSITSIDSGFVFDNIRLDYRFALLPDSYTFTAKAIRADFLGGEITIPTFTLTGSSQNLYQEQAIDVVLSGIDLGSVVSLANYPEVVVQGSVSGYIPLSLTQDENGSTVTVSEGLISALKPGGSIRYTPLGGISSSNQSIQLVNEALANYQFTTLDTTLELDDAGELNLGVVLSGSNPELNAGQAINLNVNINDNLRALLQSLQASRKLTEELEQRLAK